MQQKPVKPLIPGRWYLIKHQDLETLLAKFVFSAVSPNNIKYSEFDHLCWANGFCDPPQTKMSVEDAKCIYIEFGKLKFLQVANVLADFLPEESIGLIESFVLGYKPGPYTYPKKV